MCHFEHARLREKDYSNLADQRTPQAILSHANPAERGAYQKLAGTLNFPEHSCLPYNSFVDSHLQQKTQQHACCTPSHG
jgi:hypothetical protein